MSFYGGIKRIDDTVFKFDKIYRTRKDMDENAQHDGVYIGRYVLVEYGERYHSVKIIQEATGQEIYKQVENSGSNDSEINPYPPTQEEKEKLLIKGIDFTLTKDVAPLQDKKYYKLKSDGKTIDLSSELIGNGSNYFEQGKDYYEMLSYIDNFNFAFYKDHRLKDQKEYSDTFDSTVWVKIFNGSIEKYIMVAELNAIIPQLSIAPTDSLEYTTEGDTTEGDTTEGDTTEDIYTFNNNKIDGAKENFINPSFDQIQDTELEYRLKMPKPLQLNVNDDNLNYNRDGFNIVYTPKNNVETVPIINFANEEKVYGNNYIHWVPDGLNLTQAYKLDGTPQKTSSKTLDMNIPVFGNIISDLYDLLFGKGTEESKWVRPFFQEDWEAARDDINQNSYKKPEGQENIHYDPSQFGKPLDNYNWLQSVSIGDILGANNIGLASILASLFGVTNPATGRIIAYYLKTGWDLNIDDNGKEPFIFNKPAVVTNSTGLIKDEENNTSISYPGDYKINYLNWVLSKTNSIDASLPSIMSILDIKKIIKFTSDTSALYRNSRNFEVANLYQGDDEYKLYINVQGTVDNVLSVTQPTQGCNQKLIGIYIHSKDKINLKTDTVITTSRIANDFNSITENTYLVKAQDPTQNTLYLYIDANKIKDKTIKELTIENRDDTNKKVKINLFLLEIKNNEASS